MQVDSPCSLPCPPHSLPRYQCRHRRERWLELVKPQGHPEAMGPSGCRPLCDLGQMYEDPRPSLQGRPGQSHRPGVPGAPPTFPTPATRGSLRSADPRLALGGLRRLTPSPVQQAAPVSSLPLDSNRAAHEANHRVNRQGHQFPSDDLGTRITWKFHSNGHNAGASGQLGSQPGA